MGASSLLGIYIGAFSIQGHHAYYGCDQDHEAVSYQHISLMEVFLGILVRIILQARTASFLSTVVLPLPSTDFVLLVKAQILKREGFQTVRWIHSSRNLTGA